MKAIVLHHKDAEPRYADVPEPVPQNGNELLVSVKAVALKHLDKSRATGSHYSAEAPSEQARVIGGDGVCLLQDGARVYAIGVSGMLAEKAIVDKNHLAKVPDAVDDATAAALPNAVFGAAMALKFKAAIQPGDVVLINGATGFTGRVAVQIAKQYGARKVIATGRNRQSLHELLSLGADETIAIDEQFPAQLAAMHAATPFDIIIDYLWGQTAETILACIKGNGAFTNKIRFVSVGSITGDTIQLSAANLRSVDLQLTGSGLGSWSRSQIQQLFIDILPEMFQMVAKGQLKVETVTAPFHDITGLWNLEVPNGRRLVVTI